MTLEEFNTKGDLELEMLVKQGGELVDVLSEKADHVIDKVNNKQDIPVKVAGRTVSMSATNWLLSLIAFLLFLHLILK